MVYTYNWILFSLKKELHSDTCYNMEEPRRHNAKWNNPDKKEKIVWFYLCELFGVVKFTDTESKMVVSRGWRRRIWEVTVKWVPFHLWEDEKALDMEGDDDYTIWLYLMAMNCASKNG